ncbi:hypothetical protein V1512DRAFT_238634 [Lipomyces arxii]|uniref:uncharacterized protein n=1 Tax=Lipomyces arxii TaxID=56418 RepID=UPI0034D0108A
MSSLPMIPRRVLGEVSANTVNSFSASKPVIAGLSCSTDSTACAPTKPNVSVEGFDRVKHSNDATSLQLQAQKNAHGMSFPKQTDNEMSPTHRSNYRKHADRLRMRLRLAYYKVRVNKQTSSFLDLSCPMAELPRHMADRSDAKPAHDHQDVFADATSVAPNSRSAKLYSAHVDASASIAAIRLQSLPAVMSDAAIRIATGTQKPQLPSRRKKASRSHTPGSVQLRHSHLDAYDAVSSINKRRKTAKRQTKSLSTGLQSAIGGRWGSSTARRNTIATGNITPEANIVTPARKRPSLPSGRKLQTLPSLGADHEVAPGIFSSPLKSALPSSAIKGTPGQIGAARSLLELGGL